MQIKKILKISALIVLFSNSSPSWSAMDGLSCTGTVVDIGVHGTDRAMLKLSSMSGIVQICNLNSSMGTTYPISAAQCKAAYSTLLTAYTLKKTISVTFDNIQYGTSCTTLLNWEVATARWVHLTE